MPVAGRILACCARMDDVDIEGIEDVVEELLALPPERFTEARNEAAKRLRAEGRRDAADAVKRLPRPSVSLWALNRLAREQPSVVEAFAEAADRLRQAYQSGGDIRAATAPERDAEARVVAAAAELVRAGGKNVSETVMRSLGETLRAAAADAEIGEALRKGVLFREPAAPSIEQLLGSLPAAPAAAPAAGRTAKSARKRDHDGERAALRERITAAKADATRARSEARAALDSAREAQREWERAHKRAEQMKKRADAAEEHLGGLQQELEELRSS
jgi:chromosome segregation ATPase